MGTATLPTIILYTKNPCPLCDVVKAHLIAMQNTYPHQLQEVDITQDRDLYARYRFIIPVLDINGRILQAPITQLDLIDALHRASQTHNRDRGEIPPSHTTGHAGPHPAVRLGITKLVSSDEAH